MVFKYEGDKVDCSGLQLNLYRGRTRPGVLSLSAILAFRNLRLPSSQPLLYSAPHPPARAIYIYISCLQRGLFTDRGLWYLSHKGGQAIFTRMLNSWRPLTFLFSFEEFHYRIFSRIGKLSALILLLLPLGCAPFQVVGGGGLRPHPPDMAVPSKCCHRGY